MSEDIRSGSTESVIIIDPGIYTQPTVMNMNNKSITPIFMMATLRKIHLANMEP